MKKLILFPFLVFVMWGCSSGGGTSSQGGSQNMSSGNFEGKIRMELQKCKQVGASRTRTKYYCSVLQTRTPIAKIVCGELWHVYNEKVKAQQRKDSSSTLSTFRTTNIPPEKRCDYYKVVTNK